MATQSLNNMTSLGAGVLGGQIAWHSAFKGKKVVIYDPFEASLENCRKAIDGYAAIYINDLGATEQQITQARSRLSFTTDLAEAVSDADIAIESVPENPDIKRDFYIKLAPLLPEKTILATNSSTLLASDFAQYTGRPEQYCALHFANLIWLMNMAEIMAHPATSQSTLIAATQFAVEIGMVPIPVQKEQNGYIMNSISVAIMSAAQTLITNGVSTPKYVDQVYMILNRGVPYGACGMMDIVGMTTLHNVFSYWGDANQDPQMLANAKYLKENFIDKGLLGRPSGQGYYTYPNPAFEAPDFLSVPDISVAEEVAKLAMPD